MHEGQLRFANLLLPGHEQSLAQRRVPYDQVLAGGSLPLDVLDARISRWVRQQVPASAKN